MEEVKIKDYISNAFRGFIKSISIGGPNYTETLQDTLRLLDIWFKYGDLKCIQDIIKQDLKEIHIECWLKVIP